MPHTGPETALLSSRPACGGVTTRKGKQSFRHVFALAWERRGKHSAGKYPAKVQHAEADKDTLQALLSLGCYVSALSTIACDLLGGVSGALIGGLKIV